jgi:hypothetical protein
LRNVDQAAAGVWVSGEACAWSCEFENNSMQAAAKTSDRVVLILLIFAFITSSAPVGSF